MNTDFSQLPSYTTLIPQVVYAYIVADFCFYWLHRLAHHPKFYWIHKVHHEAINTTVYNAMSVHPLEWWFVDVAIWAVGVTTLGNNLHVVTYLTIIMWGQLSNLDDHFGYEFPWMCTKPFPWNTTNTFHNYHHLVNIGNYAAHMVWWDSIFGTCGNYIEHFETQEELKKDKSSITQIKLKTE